jgi:WD40 repeat protein
MTAEQRAGYDAFMSYSRVLDGRLAPAFQRELERFAKPWYRVRSLRVFRDDANLTANPGLWSSIEAGLAASEWFVLMASPEAARSPWVTREVAWWLGNRSPQRLLIVLTGGEAVWDERAGDFDWEASTALPQTLRGVFREEPRWVDLRGLRAKEHVDRANPEFRDRVADVAAAVRGKPKDALIGEHLRQHRRAMRLARGGVTTLALLLIATTVAAALALNEALAAETQAQVALSRQLAAQAVNDLSVNPSRAMLLSIEAGDVSDTAEARSALLTAVQRRPGTILDSGVVPVAGQSYSPDGALLATASNGGITLWNVRTRQRAGPALTVPGEYLLTAAFSPDGRFLAAANDTFDLARSKDTMGMVFLWDVRTRRQVGALPQRKILPISPIGVAFSPDGRLLAVAADDGQVTLWDLRTLQLARSPLVGNAPIAFSHDGRLLAAADANNHALMLASPPEDQRIALWDVHDGAALGSFVEPRVSAESGGLGDLGVQSLAFSPDDALLAAGSADHLVRLWRLSTHQLVQPVLDGHTKGPVASVAFSPDGRLLASGGEDGAILVWDRRPATDPAGSYALVAALRGHTGPVNSVVFGPDGALLASGSSDGTSMLWSTRTFGELGSLLSGRRLGGLATVSRALDVIATVDDETNSLRTEDVRTGMQLSSVPLGDGWRAIVVAVSPDGRLVAAGSNDGRVQVWDWRSRAKVDDLVMNPPNVVTALGFSADDRMLAAGVGNTVVVRDVRAHRPTGTALRWTVADGLVSLTFSPDGRLLAGAAFGGLVLWDLRSGQPGGTVLAGVGPVPAFSPDSTLLASEGPNDTIVLWDVRTHARRGEPIAGHQDAVRDLVFSPDGSLLASSGDDQTIRLWDVTTQQSVGLPLSPAIAAGNAGATIAFDHTGRRLVSVDTEGASIVQWDTDVGSWRARACAAAGRNLDLAEWQHALGTQRPYRRSCSQYPAGRDAPRSAPIDG